MTDSEALLRPQITLEDIARPERCALLVIDVQKDNTGTDGLLARNGVDITWARSIIPNVRRIVDAARSLGCPVIFTKNTFSRDGLVDSPGRVRMLARSAHARGDFRYQMEGQPGHDVIDELEPLDTEAQISKFRSSAFHGTHLDFILRGAKIETTVVVGLMTQACVESTVRDAESYGYLPLVISDAVNSNDPVLHEAAMTVMRARYDVLDTSGLLELWGNDR